MFDDSDMVARLRECLAEYDGRAINFLGEAEAAFAQEAGYLDALITLVGECEEHFANGSSWLIKSALESGRALSGRQVSALVERLENVHDWAAQLHICQLVRHLEIPEDCAGEIGAWVQALLKHKRPFVRAWALDALGALATSHNGYARRFNAALQAASEDEAASVRARARHLAPL